METTNNENSTDLFASALADVEKVETEATEETSEAQESPETETNEQTTESEEKAEETVEETAETEESEEQQEEESEESKKQNAITKLSQKLGNSKKEVKNLEQTNKELLKKIAKLTDSTAEELETAIKTEEASQEGMTVEARDRIESMQTELDKFKQAEKQQKLESGFEVLLDNGATEEGITEFMNDVAPKLGFNFKEDPNPELMLTIWKGTNYNKLIEKDIQEKLKVEKDVILDNTNTTQETPSNTNEPDAWELAMLAHAKNN